MIDQKVQIYSTELAELGIEHKVLEHPELTTVAEVQHYLHDDESGAAATLIMKAGDQFVAVVKRGNMQLDSKKLKKILGVSSLRMATAEEMDAVVGTPVGAAKVYNVHLPTFLDIHLFEREYLNGGTGSFTYTFAYKTADLKKIPNAQVVYITQGERADSNRKQRVLSGIRATGRLHLGNYLGAVKGMLALQDDPTYETLYMVADVHTLTTPYQVEELQQNRREVFIDYIAAGLDPTKSILFQQAEVSEHVELAFYFSSVMSIARMQHLPTFKDKVKQYPEAATMALLNYPILMAADILVYKAGLVPVGIDQEPHLEVTREVARKMNETYGTDFPEPVRFATKGEYVPSLRGEGKMSKSVEGSYINLTDSLETIKKRLAGAPTDSGKGTTVPRTGGVANLLTFVELFQGKERYAAYEQQYLGSGIRYGDLKAELAAAIFAELQPIQEKRKELEADPEKVDTLMQEGAERARAIARETVEEVKQKMGLA